LRDRFRPNNALNMAEGILRQVDSSVAMKTKSRSRLNVEDDLIRVLSLEYVCRLTTNRLSLRIDCSARCVVKCCFYFCFVHVRQLSHRHSRRVDGPRTLCLLNWATCLIRLRAPAVSFPGISRWALLSWLGDD